MDLVGAPSLLGLKVRRRAFEAWSILVPLVFQETFVAEEQYWHAWTDDASISLTSFVMTERRRAVSADALIAAMSATIEEPHIDDLPPGLKGCAAIMPTKPPSRASTCLIGLLAVDGRLLLATTTSDDLVWVKDTWRSIQGHPAALPKGAKPARPASRIGGRAGSRGKAA